jgi:hypothetical protein
MQPIELWVVHYRLGPGEEGQWAARAWDAEDAMDRFLESAGEFYAERDVVAVRRAPELDS